MKIHHINCGTMYPLMTHWIHGIGSFRNRPPLVTHCLLIETEDGLLLVDTGFGRRDIQHPTPIVRQFMHISCHQHGLGRDLSETAAHQIQRLGYQPEDVKHIAITHMHLDHVGGLPDFPNAQVHIYAKEYEGIMQPHTLEEKYICRREHWAHNPKWVVHELADDWFGFPCTAHIRLSDIALTFVPFTGHTRGHSAVAIRTQDGWLVHCGDTYVYHGDVQPDQPYYPPRYHLTLAIMGFASYAFRFLGDHSHKLRKLLREHSDEVQIFCSHDPAEFLNFSPEYHFRQEFKPLITP